MNDGRHPATIVLSAASSFIVWSDGSQNPITESEALQLQSRGDVPLVIYSDERMK